MATWATVYLPSAQSAVILILQTGYVQAQLLIAVFGILGAGLSAYVGVRVAQAKMQQDIKNLQECDGAHDKRLERLERPYFDRR